MIFLRLCNTFVNLSKRFWLEVKILVIIFAKCFHQKHAVIWNKRLSEIHLPSRQALQVLPITFRAT